MPIEITLSVIGYVAFSLFVLRDQRIRSQAKFVLIAGSISLCFVTTALRLGANRIEVAECSLPQVEAIASLSDDWVQKERQSGTKSANIVFVRSTDFGHSEAVSISHFLPLEEIPTERRTGRYCEFKDFPASAQAILDCPGFSEFVEETELALKGVFPDTTVVRTIQLPNVGSSSTCVKPDRLERFWSHIETTKMEIDRIAKSLPVPKAASRVLDPLNSRVDALRSGVRHAVVLSDVELVEADFLVGIRDPGSNRRDIPLPHVHRNRLHRRELCLAEGLQVLIDRLGLAAVRHVHDMPFVLVTDHSDVFVAFLEGFLVDSEPLGKGSALLEAAALETPADGSFLDTRYRAPTQSEQLGHRVDARFL
ncbi:hypothetical protein AC249_AIPGENE4985 [Exaiptasia diaphana]|nr:hypothetical protein AC249_AIPGENE4985 [Exaiptasia diaphana]